MLLLNFFVVFFLQDIYLHLCVCVLSYVCVVPLRSHVGPCNVCDNSCHVRVGSGDHRGNHLTVGCFLPEKKLGQEESTEIGHGTS